MTVIQRYLTITLFILTVFMFLSTMAAAEDGRSTILRHIIPGNENDNKFLVVFYETAIKVMIPDTAAESGSTIGIPIKIDEVTGQNIYSADITLTFDQSILDAQSVTTTGTIAQGWGAPTFSDSLGKIRIAMAGSSALTGNGPLLFITFKVMGVQGQTTPLHLQNFTFNVNGFQGQKTMLHFQKVIFNEGTPAVITKDGILKATNPINKVKVSLPDTSAGTGEIVAIPIRVEDVSGLGINLVTMELAFSTDILKIMGLSTLGTITENWGVPIYILTPGKISVIMNGASALNGKGVLIYINFSVTGIKGQSTVIHFDTLVFNMGIPPAITQDGVFSVMKTGIGEAVPFNLPGEFRIDQNYPNPFNSITIIRYQLPQTSSVTLKILDVNGREIKTLQSSIKEPGYHSVSWNGMGKNGCPISSGIFICQMQAGKYLACKKLVYIK